MRDAASTVKVSQLKGFETVPLGLKVSVGKSLRPAIQKIVRELAPQKIVLFGSYAYGRPNPHSDVDLLVIMETNQPHKERSWAVSRLLLPRPFPVDILVKTPKEVKDALASGDFFLKEILTRGVVLYERVEENISSPIKRPGCSFPYRIKPAKSLRNNMNDT